MRILFCSPNPLTRQLGAPKALIELSDALRPLGWQCDFVEPADLGMPTVRGSAGWATYAARLRDHLCERGAAYDVLDVDHEHLPYDRRLFAPRTLVVARSALLAQHLETLHVPRAPGLRQAVGRLVYGRSRAAQVRARVARADRTVREADLVNVNNHHDRAELMRRGVPPEKIVVLHLGLPASHHALLSAPVPIPPDPPTVAFVGTFDYRKGAGDFPELVARVAARVPSVRFRLLGTAGLFPTADAVLRAFPRRLRGRLDVRPRFDPAELPALLADCSAGVFPSYYEGFGFGVLEMLAAGLPVTAYDAPGPGEMLGTDELVPPGDIAAMATRVADLLLDRPALIRARVKARRTARRFPWAAAARATADAYTEHHAHRLRSAA